MTMSFESLSRMLRILVSMAIVCGALSVALPDEAPEPGWIGMTFGNPLGPHPSSVTDGDRDPLLVGMVARGGPAAKAGIRGRDTIVSFAGQGIEHARQFISLVRNHGPGDWATLTIRRGKLEREFRIHIAERPEERNQLVLRRAWLGVESLSLPISLQKHFGGDENAGVLISDVVIGSPAESAGIRIGDLLVHIEGKNVSSKQVLATMVSAAGVGNTIDVELVRNGVPIATEVLMRQRPEGVGR